MSSETYRRWAAGCCPCCGGSLTGYIDGTEPEAIGEGVSVCGRCAAMQHVSAFPELGAAMLEAIARRLDDPLDTLMA